MEVLKISNTKIKIMLTKEDVEKYSLNVDDVDYNDPKTSGKVWRILDVVKKEHGFSSEGDKLLIQFSCSRSSCRHVRIVCPHDLHTAQIHSFQCLEIRLPAIFRLEVIGHDLRTGQL